MRKATVALLVLMLSVSVLSGCSGTPTIAKIGLGQVTSIGDSSDKAVNAEGVAVAPRAQIDTVVAAVAFDKDGKVMKVFIDTAQSRVAFDENMALATDTSVKGKTKVELGNEYNMKRASAIGKEWFEQAAELEKWMAGKTVEQIKGMKTKQRDESHPSVPDVPELTSLVTISVQDYIAAVEEAYKNAVEVGKGAVKLGIGHEISLAGSKGYSKSGETETLPFAQVDFTMAAVAFDKDNKVVKALIDTAQTRVAYSAEGAVTTDKTVEPKTKKELGDAYNLKRASAIGKEWYQQITELENWMVGKTASQIASMQTAPRDPSHPAVPAVPELTSLVTITVQDYIAAVSEASQKAE